MGFTRARLVREITSQILVPVLIIFLLYQAIPLVIGQPFTLRWAGSYFIPDIVLILVLVTAPDLSGHRWGMSQGGTLAVA